MNFEVFLIRIRKQDAMYVFFVKNEPKSLKISVQFLWYFNELLNFYKQNNLATGGHVKFSTA